MQWPQEKDNILLDLTQLQTWQPPAHWWQVQTLDCHTGGEPLRIILSGMPAPAGNTVLARREDCLARLDHFRQLLMYEPRGHADMYGVLLTAPERPDSLFGAIFMHNEGYSSMCGHATLALTKIALQCGLVAAESPVTSFRIDVPAGQLQVFAEIDADGAPGKVWFDNVPSFRPTLGQGATLQPAALIGAAAPAPASAAADGSFRVEVLAPDLADKDYYGGHSAGGSAEHLPVHPPEHSPEHATGPAAAGQLAVDVPGIGTVQYQLGFGGAYYAYVAADSIGLVLEPKQHPQIIAAGRAIKQAVAAQVSLQHPEAPELGELYGTIFYQQLGFYQQPGFNQQSECQQQPAATPQQGERLYRNVCIFADGELDRSPTGSGVAGFAAILHANGVLKVGDTIRVRSIINSEFGVEVRQSLDHHGLPAIIPRVSGEAYLTGRQQFFLDPADPFSRGFLLR